MNQIYTIITILCLTAMVIINGNGIYELETKVSHLTEIVEKHSLVIKGN